MSRFGSPSRSVFISFNKQKKNFNNCKGCLLLKNRCIISSNVYPCYAYWLSRCSMDSDDDEFMINLTESENESDAIKPGRRFRLRSKTLKPQNSNKITDFTESAISIDRFTITERNLDTLWKLYRNAGETVEDVKYRLIDLPSSKKDNHKTQYKTSNYFTPINEKKTTKRRIVSDDTSSDCEQKNSIEGRGKKIKKILRRRDFVSLLDPIHILKVELDPSNRNKNQQPNSCNVRLSSNASLEVEDPISRLRKSICSSDSETAPAASVYDVPRLKPITNAPVTRQPRKRRAKPMIRKTSRQEKNLNYDDVELQLKPSVQTLKRTSTTGNNFKVSRLSDTSIDEEMEFVAKDLVTMNQFSNKRKCSEDSFFKSYAPILSSDSEENESTPEVTKKRKALLAEREDSPMNRSCRSNRSTEGSLGSYTCSRSSCSSFTSTTSTSTDYEDDEQNE